MFSLIRYSVSAGQNDLLRRVGHVWTWKHFDSFHRKMCFSLSPCKSPKNFPQPSPQPSPQVFLSSQETFPFYCIISAALQDTPCAVPLLFLVVHHLRVKQDKQQLTQTKRALLYLSLKPTLEESLQQVFSYQKSEGRVTSRRTTGTSGLGDVITV